MLCQGEHSEPAKKVLNPPGASQHSIIILPRKRAVQQHGSSSGGKAGSPGAPTQQLLRSQHAQPRLRVVQLGDQQAQ